jgi:hypothetical protein
VEKSKKSLGVIDVLENGNIYIEAGQTASLITRLGKNSKGSFVPYSFKKFGLPIFYAYLIKKDYVPAIYKSTDEFVTALESQVDTNSYIQNYIRLGAESLNDYLKKFNLLDSNVYFVSLKSDSNVTSYFFDYLIQNNEAKYIRNLLQVNEDISVEELSLSKLVKDDEKDKYKQLISNVQRPDRNYTFDDIKLDNEQYYYFDGFVTVDQKKLNEIKDNAEIIIVSDFISTSALVHEAYRMLNDMGFKVFAAVCLAKHI